MPPLWGSHLFLWPFPGGPPLAGLHRRALFYTAPPGLKIPLADARKLFFKFRFIEQLEINRKRKRSIFIILKLKRKSGIMGRGRKATMNKRVAKAGLLCTLALVMASCVQQQQQQLQESFCGVDFKRLKKEYDELYSTNRSTPNVLKNIQNTAYVVYSNSKGK